MEEFASVFFVCINKSEHKVLLYFGYRKNIIIKYITIERNGAYGMPDVVALIKCNTFVTRYMI